MEARGYDPMNIRGHFAVIVNLKRQDALKKVERRKKKWKERINSGTLEISTQIFRIKRALSKKFIHNILLAPEKFKGTFIPIKTIEEKTRNH